MIMIDNWWTACPLFVYIWQSMTLQQIAFPDDLSRLCPQTSCCNLTSQSTDISDAFTPCCASCSCARDRGKNKKELHIRGGHMSTRSNECFVMRASGYQSWQNSTNIHSLVSYDWQMLQWSNLSLWRRKQSKLVVSVTLFRQWIHLL